MLSMLAALLSPIVLAVLGVWLVGAIIMGVLRFIGWVLRISFGVIVGLFVVTVVLAVLGIPLATLAALIAAAWSCTRFAHV